MAQASSTRPRSRRALRVRCVAWLGALASALGCAEVLGIPTDPEFISPPIVEMPLEPNLEPPPGVSASGGAGGEPAAALDRPNSDGIVPTENVSGIDGAGSPTGEPPSVAPEPPPTSTPRDGGIDAGPPADLDAGPTLPAAPDECEGELGREPVDVLFIVDNTGTMTESNAAFEQALPDLAEQLDELLVDYRLILLSRHRDAERGTSEAADSSVCITAPLGGVAACPSPAPALGGRLFHYSLPIGASDSFSQALAALDRPDPFGLTSIGWSEWLRAGARKVVVEITDTDSALTGAEFVSALAAALPEHFANDPSNPGFVFHGILGLRQKVQALDLYGPDEPVETDLCTGIGSSPGSAGATYQQLSRSTGGLRQSICPATVMGIRLRVLAADIARRSVVACP